jgi:ribose transport system permease protein
MSQLTVEHPTIAEPSKLMKFLKTRGREFGLPLALLCLVVFFAFNSDVFLGAANLRNVALQAAALAAVAVGQTFVIMNADLDLSVGSNVALVSVVSALAMASYGVPVGIVAGLATGAFVGLLNAIAVTRFHVMAFIATLAMLSIAQGVALNFAGGTPVTGIPGSFADFAFKRFFGVPAPFLISVALIVVAAFTFKYTRLGRNIYAVGGNSDAARLSGIPVRKTRVWAFVIAGLCAAIGSLILTSRVGSGQPTLGASLALESVAAVVLGGVSLFGGRGSIIGVAFGVAFVSILSNGLNLMNVSSYTQLMIVGIALIAAVAADQALSRQKK